MSRIYENWDRLVGATLCREELRRLSLMTPTPSELSSVSSSFSFPARGLSFDFSELLVGNSFTYDQILQATDSLSHSNLIKKGHSGDLYIGVFEDGSRAVIKRIDLSSQVNRELHLRFISELEFMRKASHSRLVPLMGHCLENVNVKFLVYKYMPNKDLSSYLSTKIVLDTVAERLQFSSLDWMTRLKIAIGAAEGLCYLHHECIPPIVHRDFEASSILLDENFEVRIGSLSEVYNAVEMFPKKTGLRNSFGCPRRGTKGKANATCAHDVSCFGKVLLQLVTGRLLRPSAAPGDSPENPVSPVSSTNHWKDLRLQIYDKDLVRSILDPPLTMEEDRFLEVWAMAIVALACLHPKPSRRPQMAQVLKSLKNRKISQSSYYEMARTIEEIANCFFSTL
ncbi:OLC1v1003206C1 [Oldenlandia corymbosa var. corymbosa]|uniref:OLC1v1003206C1 n=1 Tax=Oldenlandia corymbosa var. corymbosa TaxID=529605 RepID=A0AAV1DCW0_OLDCO|nr:OLC1v1003206C1 [Oldenlandia corymbosa var. corymbosa]